MKIRLVFILIITMLCLVSSTSQQPVYAQSGTEPTGFKNVTLWLNPEYDDPRLLVMLEGKIDGTTAPALVRFLVPRDAEMFSAGSIDAQGGYSGGPPDRKTSQIPGWDEISYIVKTDTFRVEYYDPVIPGQPDKKISYDFQRLYPISDLSVVVQEPRPSSNFIVEPQGTTGRDGEGFAVHRYYFSNLDSSSPVHFDITYTRSDPNPSVKNPNLNSSNTGSSRLGLILGLISAIILVGGLFMWLARTGRKARPASGQTEPRQKRRTAKNRSPSSRFCSHCGRQVDKQSRFCPSCWSKLSA